MRFNALLIMSYDRYTVQDFVLDDSFQSYVLCTDPEAVAFWTAWVSQHLNRDNHVRQATELIRLLTGPKQLTPVSGQQAELRRLIEQLPSTHSRPPRTRQPVYQIRYRYQNRRLLIGLVAWLLLAGSGWFGYTILRQPEQVSLTTGFGQKRTVFLPDGSQVVLNANSTLRYRSDWPENQPRQVWLEGEAFFHVSKQRLAGKPVKFTVRAGGLAVEVLGTQFNVFNRLQRTQVVLEEGSVRLRSAETARTLLDMAPGESVVYSQTDRVLSRQRVDPSLHDAWRTNRLVFDDTPLSEVGDLIAQTYGKTLVFADSGLSSRRLSGTIPSDNLGRLTKALSRAFGLRITDQGDELIIEAN